MKNQTTDAPKKRRTLAEWRNTHTAAQVLGALSIRAHRRGSVAAVYVEPKTPAVLKRRAANKVAAASRRRNRLK